MTQSSQRCFLLTPPDQLSQAQTFGLPLGHMAFRIGPQGQLLQSALPPSVKGGLMLLGAGEDTPTRGDPRQTVGAVLSVCLKRGFAGVILDLEQPPTPFLARLITALDQGLAQQGRALFLPEEYSSYSRRAILFLSSALSGGSLRLRLEQMAETYGPNRLALCLRRVREDFFLPAPKGEGRPLTQEELDRRIRQLAPSVFFSRDLCAYYFTYMSRETGAHFVLFDRADSLKKKQEVALSVGIHRFLLLYPETEDLLPGFLQR